MATSVTNKYHPHPLELVQLEGSYTCNLCKERSFGQRYSCICRNDCDQLFHAHEVCINPPLETKHAFFGENNFFFMDSKYDQNCFCDACGRDIEGSSYHSRCGSKDDPCSFYGTYPKCPGHDLHPYCALTLPPNQEISKDNVKLTLKKKLSSKCGLCRHESLPFKTEKGEKLKSWGYVSENKKEQYHLYCVKKNLIEKAQMMTFTDESAMIISTIRNHSQIHARNGNNRNGGGSNGIMRKIKLALSLIVSVLFGNPTPIFVHIMSDIASSLLYD